MIRRKLWQSPQSLTVKVLKALGSDTLDTKAIASRLGWDSGNTRDTLCGMTASGHVERVSRGVYRAPVLAADSEETLA